MKPARFLAVPLVATLAVAGSALSQSAGVPQGLVLHYGFDRADEKGVVKDQSGLGHDGRSTGARWVSSGKQGGGCVLSPTGGTVRASWHSGGPKGVTLALWLRSTRPDSTPRLLLTGKGGPGCALGTGGAPAGKLAFRVGTDTPSLSDAIVSDGEWHHAAISFDGQAVRLYVDGKPQGQTTPCREDLARALGDVSIGGIEAQGPSAARLQAFDGTIDELMLFRRALTAGEISAMVAAVDPSAGKPKFTKQQVAGRLRQLRQLLDEGLITEDFYTRKVAECEALK